MSMSAPEPGTNEIVDQGFGLMPQQDEGTQPEPQGQQQEVVKLNEAWNPLLEKLPASLHNLVTPELKQWDRNYNDSLQKVHSQYAGYKPFLEQQIDPEVINNALLISNALDNDPTGLIAQLIDYYKYEVPQQAVEQGQGNQPQDESVDEGIPYDVTQHPEFQRMKQVVELLGQNTLQQNEQVLQQETDAQVEQEFAAALQKHGNFDEGWVAQTMYVQGVDIDTAVGMYRQLEQNIVQQHQASRPAAPVMMGGGGGLPSQQTQVSKMTEAQRRNLIVQTLAANAQEQGG